MAFNGLQFIFELSIKHSYEEIFSFKPCHDTRVSWQLWSICQRQWSIDFFDLPLLLKMLLEENPGNSKWKTADRLCQCICRYCNGAIAIKLMVAKILNLKGWGNAILFAEQALLSFSPLT